MANFENAFQRGFNDPPQSLACALRQWDMCMVTRHVKSITALLIYNLLLNSIFLPSLICIFSAFLKTSTTESGKIK